MSYVKQADACLYGLLNYVSMWGLFFKCLNKFMLLY